MSTKRNGGSRGCSVDRNRHGRLRLRFRWRGQQIAFGTAKLDTPENREKVGELAAIVVALIAAGQDPLKFLRQSRRPSASCGDDIPSGTTVRSYFETWIAERSALVRRAQARDYRRHIAGYVLPRLGSTPLALLRPSDVRGLQAELLARGLSVKTVKNILSGSFRAMIVQAKVDELVTRDVFAGLRWPEWTPPDPDPLTARERDQILGWFEQRRYGFPPAPGTFRWRSLLHPPFHAYVHTLMWTGMRPSEASGLQWGDVDLKRRSIEIRRSRHLYNDEATKTRRSRRTVELFPQTVELLRAIQPLHVQPQMPVFTTTKGEPIEPKTFSEHWYRCLRALGFRVRGLYCTKDTFVSTALDVGVKIAWLEAQTGVRYETLRRHYGKWMPREGRTELERFAALDSGLFRVDRQRRRRHRE